jgi:hypothetical protein
MSDNWFLGSKEEKGSKSILACLGIGGAVATVLVFSVLFFTEIRLTAEGILSLSLHFALLFFSSYVMYFSLFETGRGRGETEESFITEKKRSALLLSRYEKEGNAVSLRSFCEETTKKERKEARLSLLSRYLMTEEEGDVLLSRKTGLSLRERGRWRALRKTESIRVTPAMLLDARKAERYKPPLAHSPEKMRLWRSLRFLAITAVTAAFSVSLAFNVLLSPTASTIAAYLLKLFTLFGSGIKGYKAGFLHVTEDVTAYRHAQNDMLEEYFKECARETRESP